MVENNVGQKQQEKANLTEHKISTNFVKNNFFQEEKFPVATPVSRKFSWFKKKKKKIQ